jgi:hypothetical protein
MSRAKSRPDPSSGGLTRKVEKTFVIFISWLSMVNPVVELGGFLERLKRTVHGSLSLV